MAIRIEWDEFEIALLIEACEEVLRKGKPKSEVVKTVSSNLRKRAISKNIAKKLVRYLNILFCLIEKIGIIEYTQKKAKYGFIWIKKSEIMAPFELLFIRKE